MQQSLPDQWFTQQQLERLSNLMAKWRVARAQGVSLPADEQAEVELLIETELQATILRSSSPPTDEPRSTNH